MSNENGKQDSFLGGLIKARVGGLKDAARQGVDDMTRNFQTSVRTIDGVVRDRGTSYLNADSDAGEPIYQVMTKGDGKNGRVTLWPDRLEWEKGRGISGGKIAAALMTGGVSLAVTGFRGNKDAFNTLPLSAIASVSLRKGESGQVVSIGTAGGDVEFSVSRQNAAQFRLAILNQLQVRDRTPSRVVIEGPVAVAQSNVNFSEQLQKLAELRDAGILSEEEFQQKKTQILGTI